MNKIMYVNMPLNIPVGEGLNYSDEKNKNISSDMVLFPINAVIGNEITSKDTLKIVLIKAEDQLKSDISIKMFKEEFERVNGKIDTKVEYVVLRTPFDEERESHFALFTDMIGELEEDSEVYMDITFGPRSTAIIATCVASVATNQMKSDIGAVVYGKVNFVDGVPTNPKLCNMTSLLYLNTFTGLFDANSKEEVIETLKAFLG